jgi:hypothetical protein
MRNIRFWIPALIGALLTFGSYFIVILADGSGHSAHAGAGMVVILVLYPLPSLFAMVFATGPSGDAFLSQVISALAFAGMVLQFPLYGFIVSYANLKRHLWLRVCAGIIWLHLIIILVCLGVFVIQTYL